MSKNHSLCLILVVLYTFFEYQCFLPTQGALRELRYFSWTNNLRLVKKVWSPSKLRALEKKHENKKVIIMSKFLSLLPTSVVLCTFFENQCFWPSRRCSARSKIFFLDKQSETCQKKFHLRQTHSSWEETWKSENLTFLCISLALCLVLVVFCMILEYLCFWYSRRCSARSKIFFCDKQQRFVKKNFTSGKLRALEKKHENPKISQFCVYLSHYVLYWWYFAWFWSICVFDPAEGALRDPRYFSVTNNLRFVKKNFGSSKLPALVKNTQIRKSHAFVHIPPVMSLIIDILQFFSICIYNPHKVLCGISDIIPRQTIWDLSNKIFSSSKLPALVTNTQIRKSHDFMYIPPVMSLISGIFQVFQYLCL